VEGAVLLDAGCGEGRDSIFFAQQGYRVTAFDASAEGVKKARAWAASLQLPIQISLDDVNQFLPAETYDVVLAAGIFHYVPRPRREQVIDRYKACTRRSGFHLVMVPVHKPFISTDPEVPVEERSWRSGEILTHYHDWRIDFFEERIVDEASGYRFAMNLLIAAEPSP